MGFFNQLLFGGKKCYNCGSTSTDFICNETGLKRLKDPAYNHIVNRCWEPGCTKCEVLYCENCGRYLVHFPQRDVQCQFTYSGSILK